jgi:hypothetical protein
LETFKIKYFDFKKKGKNEEAVILISYERLRKSEVLKDLIKYISYNNFSIIFDESQ